MNKICPDILNNIISFLVTLPKSENIKQIKCDIFNSKETKHYDSDDPLSDVDELSYVFEYPPDEKTQSELLSYVDYIQSINDESLHFNAKCNDSASIIELSKCNKHLYNKIHNWNLWEDIDKFMLDYMLSARIM